MEWMLLPLRRYADFSGRSRRKEYWMYALFQALVYALLLLILLAGVPWSEIANQNQTGVEPQPGILVWGAFALMGLFWVGTVIPSIAVTVRRLHDQDLSGWMYLLVLIPYLGAFAIFVFTCIAGTRGPNRFGADPLDPNEAEVFR